MSAHRRRIGGSDIAKLLGLSPYGGPLEVYERIVLGKEAEWNAAMQRGAAVEPVLRALAQNMLGVEVEETESDYHKHPTLEYAHAQIDDLARWSGLPVVVDYKSCNRFAKGWGAAHTDQVPEHQRAQFAWEMMCADRELCIPVVGFGEDVPPPEIFSISHVLPYQVERCPLFESHMKAVASEFWERHILPEVPPPSTGRKPRKRKS
jgi:predicted phage-related endonuclease